MEDQNTQQQPPLNPDLAGYPSVEALVAGYRNSSDEGKKQRERADKLEQLATQLMSNAGNQRQDVPDRRGRPEDRLTQYGVPVDALDEYVQEKVMGALEPLTRGIQARGQVVSEHPDYVQFEADVARFIENDNELSQRYPNMFKADPVAAMEYAFLKFSDSRRRSVPTPSDGGSREGMADASIPGSRAGDGRRAPSQDSAIQEAFERWQKSGSSKDAAAFAKARLRTVITDDFLSQ